MACHKERGRQDGQKCHLLTRPPRTRKTRAFPVGGRSSESRGGTYEASLEPLASIKFERIVTLPPVGLDQYIEAPSDARTKLAAFSTILPIRTGVLR